MNHRLRLRRLAIVPSLSLLAMATVSTAQMRFEGEPAAATSLLPPDVPTVAVPEPDVARYRAEDEARNHWPLRYGAVVATHVDMASMGRWDAAADGGMVWRVRISSPGAHSLGLEFLRFRMPPGAKLFLYDEEMVHVHGAYDRRNHNPDGEFTTSPFPGDSLILEYHQPAGSTEHAELIVDHVIHDYRDIFELERELDYAGRKEAYSGSINGCPVIDVNCPEGDPYPELKRATVRTLSGGGLCSGVLLNNTAQDGTPYLYTANHCNQNNNVTIRFNFQRSGCCTGGAPSGQEVQGATLLATDCAADGRLMRINNTIPASYDHYLMGWSRIANFSFGLGVSMHHPSGNSKKISIDNNGGFQTTAVLTSSPTCPFGAWQINWHSGSTSGGSSGGGLIDGNGRVRGVLSGGDPDNCDDAVYGRFFTFWNISNISTFLDPLGTNQTNLGGLDPSCSTPSNYGAGEFGSTGNLAIIGSSGGLPSVTNNNFEITLTGCTPNVLSFLLESDAMGSIPTSWGTILVGQPFVRHVSMTDGNGEDSFLVPMNPSLIGTSLFYMWVARDPGFGGGAQHSNGLQVTFCP